MDTYATYLIYAFVIIHPLCVNLGINEGNMVLVFVYEFVGRSNFISLIIFAVKQASALTIFFILILLLILYLS
jgi:hypothetical protein